MQYIQKLWVGISARAHVRAPFPYFGNHCIQRIVLNFGWMGPSKLETHVQNRARSFIAKHGVLLVNIYEDVFALVF